LAPVPPNPWFHVLTAKVSKKSPKNPLWFRELRLFATKIGLVLHNELENTKEPNKWTIFEGNAVLG
jgi:hypothetical protein